jgi:predicted enzyme related to lactoylglutathione lyase
MKLRECVFHSEDVSRLCEFYGEVLQMEIESGETYRQIDTAVGTLALCSLDLAEEMAPGVVSAGTNRSVMLQFEVEDVDEEYERLSKMGVEWIKPPTTQPWGSRSVWFLDPDGNAIDFFCRPGEDMAHPPYTMTHCCMVTNDVRRLGNFYMDLVGIQDSAGEKYEELDLDGGILAVCAFEISNGMAPGVFVPGENKGVVVGFEVEDADLEYERLVEKGVSCVKPLETYKWGTRSAWFRDPDGGIVNLLSVV